MRSVKQCRDDLLQILIARAFKRGDFTLASGAKSDYYIDVRMCEVYSPACPLIGELLYDRVRDLNFQAVGGLEVGAVPLTVALLDAYHLLGDRQSPLEGFWVRKSAKSHGTKKRIEGNLQPGWKVVILDDVVTTGESSLKALDAVQEFGCEVVKVVALVDRLHGAAEAFSRYGIPYESIYTIKDFGV